jgi:hypothetical protein
MGNASALPILLNNHDHAQKRIQVSDRSCEPPKILDPSSSSQIHLWSKSQISNRLATYLEPFHESLTIGMLELLLTADSVYGDSGSGYNLEYLLS